MGGSAIEMVEYTTPGLQYDEKCFCFICGILVLAEMPFLGLGTCTPAA